MSTAAARPQIEVNGVRATLAEMYSCLRAVNDEVAQDHRKISVCSNFGEYAKETPGSWLERAGQRLAKKEYKIAFVGPYKAGKSTFLSALFRQPGMLPAQDAECTFAVTVVSTPPPGQQESVRVSYWSAEEALRNVIDNTTYAELHQHKRSERDDILRSFAADRAVEFIRECAEKHKVGENAIKGAQLLHFLKSYREHRDRLGKEHIDGISNLDAYVRKPNDTDIGHLLLIKRVEIFMQNEVLQKHGFQIADTPGIDSLNQAARDITFNFVREADAVVYVADAKGLTDKFDDVRKHMSQFQNDIREKMFIVANRADWYDVKTMKRMGGDKAQIEVIFENIVGPLRAFGINENRLHFTCGGFSELATRREKGQAAREDEIRYNELRSVLDERRNALDGNINPVLHRQLTACFRDGGVDHFRSAITEYLDYDIQVERLREIYRDLERAYTALGRLLQPEQSRLKDILASLKTKSQQIQEFFDQVKDRFLEKVAVLGTGAPRAIAALMDKAREQTEQTIASAVERLNIDRVRMRLRVPAPLNIKMEVISFMKADLSVKVTQIVRDAISPVFRAKLDEQVAESRVGEILTHLAKGFGGDFDTRFQALMDGFNGGLNLFTMMRTREETWELLDMEMKPASFEVEWNEKVEAEFRIDLKNIFTERFVDSCGRLKAILARHYQGFIQDLSQDFERLLDEVSATIKRDPDRVAMPRKLLTGNAQETEDEVKQRCLLSYSRQHGILRKMHDEVAPHLAGA